MMKTHSDGGPWLADGAHVGQPLGGLRVLDFTQMGPGPWATSFLAAWGADVITVVRPQAVEPELVNAHYDAGKRRVELNLKTRDGVELARRLAGGADIVFEGFRPGAMERLGLGPSELRKGHEGLIYIRLTGYGQDGPYAHRAGHDINYLAVSGALSAIGRGEPAPPLAMLGDFAGGGLHAVVGVLMALRARDATGAGDVVDAAIVDGVSQLFYSTAIHGTDNPRVRLLDGTAPFYTTYQCSDGRRISVGALESRFFARLLELMDIHEPTFLERQYDEAVWPAMREKFAERFANKPRDEWVAILAEQDTCIAPVLEADELTGDPHHIARETYTRNGAPAVARAPRLGAVAQREWRPDRPPSATRSVLQQLGVTETDLDRLSRDGVIGTEVAPLDTPG